MYMISMIIIIQTFIDSDNSFFLDHHITRKRETLSIITIKYITTVI